MNMCKTCGSKYFIMKYENHKMGVFCNICGSFISFISELAWQGKINTNQIQDSNLSDFIQKRIRILESMITYIPGTTGVMPDAARDAQINAYKIILSKIQMPSDIIEKANDIKFSNIIKKEYTRWWIFHDGFHNYDTLCEGHPDSKPTYILDTCLLCGQIKEYELQQFHGQGMICISSCLCKERNDNNGQNKT